MSIGTVFVNNRTQAVLLAGKLAVDPDKVVPPDTGELF